MPRALAIAAHPDDIEFVMAGTLLLLKAAGWEIHCFNVSSGNLGSLSLSSAETARVRRAEAKQAAKILGATWHAPIARDLEIFYKDATLRRLASVVRAVDPAIVLTHSPEDYMEDHMNTARLAVTATFARGVPSFRTVPPRVPVHTPATLYHATPHGLRDGMRRLIRPGSFVNTEAVHAQKRAALAAHASQQEWLDATQGLDGYLNAMDGFSREVGALSGRFALAEGWRRHLHLGLGKEAADPLADALGPHHHVCAEYERRLSQ